MVDVVLREASVVRVQGRVWRGIQDEAQEVASQ